jgi:hypothetical protein
MKLKQHSLVLLLLLAACAPEKKTTKFDPIDGDEGGSGASTPCSRNYSPLPILRDGLNPLPSADLLPEGTYLYAGGEFFAREEGVTNGFQAHFLEEFRDIGMGTRKICATTLSNDALIELSFPTAREVVRTPEGARSYRPSVSRILGEGGSVRLTRSAPGDPVSGSLAAVLQNYSQWRIYLLSASSFEIRAVGQDPSSDSYFTKRMVLRFNLKP